MTRRLPFDHQPEIDKLKQQVADLQDAHRKTAAQLSSLELFVKSQADTEKDETSLTKAAVIRMMKTLGMIQ